MTIDDATDVAAFLDADLGAVTITFTPASGPAVSVPVLINRGQDIVRANGPAALELYNTQITVAASAIVGDPIGGVFSGAVIFAGLSYRVAASELDAVGTFWTCQCEPTT